METVIRHDVFTFSGNNIIFQPGQICRMMEPDNLVEKFYQCNEFIKIQPTESDPISEKAWSFVVSDAQREISGGNKVAKVWARSRSAPMCQNFGSFMKKSIFRRV